MNVFAGIIGHIGDGNFHGIILHDKDEPDERRRVEQCVHNMVGRALDMDGTCTVSYSKAVFHTYILIRVPFLIIYKGEHGIGIGKKDFLLQELGQDTVDVMRDIKLALDPRWLLNPGKIFH